eukprot:jgi/Hompol1/2879/HPOL_003055-RA
MYFDHRKLKNRAKALADTTLALSRINFAWVRWSSKFKHRRLKKLQYELAGRVAAEQLDMLLKKQTQRRVLQRLKQLIASNKIAANSRIRTAVLRKVLKALRENAQICKEEREQELDAAKFYQQSLLGKCLEAWTIFTRHARTLQTMQKQAEQFRYYSLLTIHIASWYKCVVVKRQIEMRWRFAMAHHDRIISKRYLVVWINSTRQQQQHRLNMVRFIETRNVTVMAYVFQVWFAKYRDAKELDRIVDSIWHLRARTQLTQITHRQQLEFRNTRVLHRAITIWTSKRSNWARIYQARHVQPIVYWGFKLTHRVFAAWRCFIQEQRDYKARIAEAKAWHKSQLVKSAFRQLFELDAQARQQRIGMLSAEARDEMSESEQRLASKYGLRWRVNAMRSSQRALRSRTRQLERIISTVQYGSVAVGIPRLRPRPQPRAPEFLFDATTGEFVRTRQAAAQLQVAPVSASTSQIAVPISLAAAAASNAPVKPSPTDLSEPCLAQLEAIRITDNELANIEAQLNEYQQSHQDHQDRCSLLTELQLALDAYLAGNHEILVQPHVRCTSMLELFDKIKVLKYQIEIFEANRGTMQQHVACLVQRLRDGYVDMNRTDPTRI